MANRHLLHRSKLSAFREWLGAELLPPVGPYEVVRWKGKQGQPMRIVFDGSSSQHLSCNEAAIPDVESFIKYCREIKK